MAASTTNTTGKTSKSNNDQEAQRKQRMNYLPLFDSRLYRKLELWTSTKDGGMVNKDFGYVYPGFDYNNYVYDFQETPAALQNKIETVTEASSDQKEALKNRKEAIQKWIDENYEKFWAPHSFVHPYALTRLAGASGPFPETVGKNLVYDRYNQRKWYEVEGDGFGGYSKNPTTTAIIRWGNEDGLGRTPYSYQDFVFSKWWNRIENNRMITLRRYAAPVLDDLSFSNLDVQEEQGKDGSTQLKGTISKQPFSPLATAVTYFGEETGNTLSDILAFSASYNWAQLKSKNDPQTISSTQAEEGQGLLYDKMTGLTSGLSVIAKATGILGEMAGKKSINWDAAPRNLPPDPYENGPYANRILGPVNVILDTYKRERGLTFKNDGLKIKFDYVARPIAGINNKAVLLDILSNILVMSYSSGSWFGGLWKYSCTTPAMFPFRYGDSMNQLYKGNLFGENGAIKTLTRNAFNDTAGGLAKLMPDMLNSMKNLVKGALNSIMGAITGDTEKKQDGHAALASFGESAMGKTVQKLIASKMLAGATIPFIKDNRALLTGDPVGDWHLTIGNPLNPIAMIGNLICKGVDIKFYDELGPDDFPIGFTATITLAHGLGRDRDAIESMFNRGKGRIYSLPATFRGSADGETKVDNFTGENTAAGRTEWDDSRDCYFGGGTRFIAAIEQSPLQNSGKVWDGNLMEYPSLVSPDELINRTETKYVLTPWQLGYIM